MALSLLSSTVAWPSKQEGTSDLENALKYIENAVMMKEMDNMRSGMYTYGLVQL